MSLRSILVEAQSASGFDVASLFVGMCEHVPLSPNPQPQEATRAVRLVLVLALLNLIV